MRYNLDTFCRSSGMAGRKKPRRLVCGRCVPSWWVRRHQRLERLEGSLLQTLCRGRLSPMAVVGVRAA